MRSLFGFLLATAVEKRVNSLTFYEFHSFRLRREHEKLLKQKAKAAEQALKVGLPKPIGSVPEPEYLKPGFLATPPPNLGMAQAMAKAQAMAAQPKAMPSSAMLQAMQATVQAAAAAAKGAIPQPSVAMVGQQLTAYPSAVQDRVRDYASVKLMTTATPEQRFAINKR